MSYFGLSIPAISWIEGVAFLGAILAVFSAFKGEMIPLRVASLFSTVAFLIHFIALQNWLLSLLMLLITLLNCVRLREMISLSNQTKSLQHSDFPYETLKSFMKAQKFHPEEALFRKGDVAKDAYYIVSGHVSLPELEIELGPGSLVGEMGMFGEKQARSVTAIAKDDLRVLRIPYHDLQELCLQNPSLGLNFFKLIVRRQLENQNHSSQHLKD